MVDHGTVEIQTSSLRDYLKVIRYYLRTIIVLLSLAVGVATIYALQAEDIYTSVSQMKITKPKSNILESPSMLNDMQSFANDRFIATEILQLKSKNFRMRIAEALLDSFNTIQKPELFYHLLEVPPKKAKGNLRVITPKQLANRLGEKIILEQIKGVDVVQVTVESPSAFEAAIIANCYAHVYKGLSVDINRDQLTLTKNFLALQRDEKGIQLNGAETNLKSFQEKQGFVSLDNQATTLISQISQIESQLNLAKIELISSDKILERYKAEIMRNDPKIVQYLENVVSEEYLRSAQAEIAKLQLSKDLALIDKTNNYYDPRVEKETDYKIIELNKKITERISTIRDNIAGRGIEDIRSLIQKGVDEEIKNQSLRTSIVELTKIFKSYDAKFNELPKSSIELAGLKRRQEALEKLYTLVDGRYQEALINEQSQPGYVSIIDYAEIAGKPSKPNRFNIILMGFFIGLSVSLGYAFIKNFFDDTVKSPEDIEKKNINLLAWIPPIQGATLEGNEFEFVVSRMPKAVASEAFKVLRTRIQYSKLKNESIKTILITSSIPSEGKTTVAANLAGSFAISNFKSLIIDCDLRKPRVHSFFNAKRTPGLVDYLFGKNTLEEIIHPTELENLFFIPCGTIPPNPAEILQSDKIKEFFAEIKLKYDFICVDSPPVVAVTDAELVSKLTDVSIVVALAGTTQMNIFERVVSQFKRDGDGFIGTILNNFNVQGSYGSYYKYYYYYYGHSDDKKYRRNKKNIFKKLTK